MQPRRVTVLVSLLCLTVSMFLPVSTGPARAKEPNLDVRGTWHLVWSGSNGKTAYQLHGTAAIPKENLRSGAFSGTYDIPEQPVGKGTYKEFRSSFSGKVRGHSAHLVGMDHGGGSLDVALSEKDGDLTLSGSIKSIRLRGTLLEPAPPQSEEGGDRSSAVDGQCTSALGAADAVYWCLIEVADQLGHKKVEQPSGHVTVAIKDATDAIVCALITPKGGKNSSCRVTVPAVNANTTFRADGSRRISVEYSGDKVFGPSEGSLVIPDQSAPAEPDAPDPGLLDDVQQVLDTALDLLALQRQEFLEIGQQLP